MANRLKGKLLRQNDEHQDSCFVAINQALYLVIATSDNRLYIYSVDETANEVKEANDNFDVDCIIDNVIIDYSSAIKQMVNIGR